jgi:hypothetical protein
MVVIGSLLAGFIGVAGCRSDFTSAQDSGHSTNTSGETNTGGTETVDPILTCMECEAEQCTVAAEACAANPDCAECVSAPFGLSCYGEDDFRRLASCSCSECSAECDYMCPGGFNACETCGLESCSAEATPCAADSECAGCFDDPLADGCQENPDFQDFLACGCEQCGQECIWTCPDAYSECNTCGLTNCAAEFSACLGDPTCAACAENPLAEGCYENEIALAALGCGCEHCEPQCGVLYACGDLP